MPQRLVKRSFEGTSLRFRVAALALSAAFLTSLVVGLSGYLVVRQMETSRLDSTLRAEARAADESLGSAYQRVEQDVRILAQLPPIEGLARTVGNVTDRADGTSTAFDWTARLLEIFSAFHSVRPFYQQIRYIGIADNGRELVRVDKRDGQITLMPKDKLQQKGDRPYFRVGRQLAPGQVYVSRIEWNQENGVIVEPRVAVARVIVPVFTTSGARFGMIVVNIEAERFLTHVMRDLPRPHDIAMVDGNGNTFLYDRASDSGKLFIGDANALPADVTAAINEGDHFERFGDKLVSARSSTSFAPDGKPIRLAVIEDASTMLAASRNASTVLGISVVIMTVLAATLAAHVARRLLAPLSVMEHEVAEARHHNRLPDLRAEHDDEIGQIAIEFMSLVNLLAERERRAKTVFDGVSDGVVIARSDGTIIDVNPALARMFGYECGELQGKNCDTLLFPDERHQHETAMKRYLATGERMSIGKTVDRRGRRKSGEAIPIELTVSEISDERGTYFAGIIRDVTERAKNEQKRQELIASLERSNAELDSFAYVASHDLKAPLNAIRNICEWIEEDLEDTLDEGVKKNLDLMRNRVNRMSRLLQDLLEHARIGRATGEYKKLPVDGKELREALTDLLNAPEGFKVEFSEDFDKIEVMQLPLQIVLLNLISNAIKHNGGATGTVKTSVEDLGKFYRFTVTDDGVGIEPRYHDRVFGLFQTLVPRDEVEGSGMGLAIVAKHVKVQGGEIGLESEGNGSGSTFYFTWPKAGNTVFGQAA